MKYYLHIFLLIPLLFAGFSLRAQPSESSLADLKQLLEQTIQAHDHEQIHALNDEIIALFNLWPEWAEERYNDASAFDISEENTQNQEQWNQNFDAVNEYYAKADWTHAIDIGEKTLIFAESRFGSKHINTLNTRFLLAQIYKGSHEDAKALDFTKQAFQDFQNVLGEKHPETLHVRLFYAEMLSQRKQYSHAEKLYREILRDSQETLGKDHPDFLAASNNYALFLLETGNYQPAQNLLEITCASYLHTLGNYHPETLSCLENQATTYIQQGLLAKAQTLLEQVIATRQLTNGENTTLNLSSNIKLAEIHRQTGRYAKAETILDESLKHILSIHPNSPMKREIQASKAMLQTSQGNYKPAYGIFQEILDSEIKVYGQDSVQVGITLGNIAEIYQQDGMFQKAEALYQQSLKILNLSREEGSMESVGVSSNLALLYENQGLHEKAERLFQSALELADKKLGPDHPTTLTTMNNRALLFESQGLYDKAESIYADVIRKSTEALGVSHPLSMAAHNNLAYVYLLQKDFQAAQATFQNIYEKWKQSLGEAHPNTLKALNNLGRSLLYQSNYEQAEAKITEALKLRTRFLGKQHPDTLRSMNDLADIHLRKQQLPEARNLIETTIALEDQVLGPQHPYTFESLNNYALILEQQGEMDKCFEVRKQTSRRRNLFFDRVLWGTGENTRESYIQKHAPEQDAYLTLLLKLNRMEHAEAALDLSMQRKGMLLRISSEIRQVTKFSTSPKLQQTANELIAHRKKLATLILSGPSNGMPEEFIKTVTHLEEQINQIQSRLADQSMLYRQKLQDISSRDVMKQIPRHSALVDYLIYRDSEPRLIAIVAHADSGTIQLVNLGNLMPIQQGIQYFRNIIQSPLANEEHVRESGHKLYQALWQPLEPFLANARTVFLVPDGLLHVLPFEALINKQGASLIQTTDLYQLSSARDLALPALPTNQGHFLILAGPDYDQSTTTEPDSGDSSTTDQTRAFKKKKSPVQLSQSEPLSAAAQWAMRFAVKDYQQMSFALLPGAETEGRIIQKIGLELKVPVNAYFLKNATERHLRQSHQPPRVLHLATHGFFLGEQLRSARTNLSMVAQRGIQIEQRELSPSVEIESFRKKLPQPATHPLVRSGLAFAGVNKNVSQLGHLDMDNDGILTAMEVLDLDLSGTRMVVLSACETGLGEVRDGEGIYGLRRAFQEAGAQSVIASLWPVSDDATQRLMTEFYKNYFSGISPGKALKQAKQILMTVPEFSPPNFWSSFVLVSSGNNTF
ncbi:MAG: CHAT domain-containing protein [SAR324 cluster bacterium]|nr:CHAT domain-containing protein [SAR324 cluster bacterium]